MPEIGGVRLSKSMGQHLLHSATIIEKIVSLSGIDGTCGVLEVGPGLGALTRELSAVSGFVTAVELDKRLIPALMETFSLISNVRVVQGDILKFDLKELADTHMPGYESYHVCANLPYNITTPAISAFIDSGVFSSMTLMVQREVAKRICAGPGTPDYGAFSVYANYHTQPSMLFNVPPECFVPPPKVMSTVITMKSRSDALLTPELEKVFFSVVRAAFGQRRKTLVNALFSSFGSALGKGDIAGIVKDCGFNVLVRGEALGIDEFARLAERMMTAV